jgi:hypothetical protein
MAGYSSVAIALAIVSAPHQPVGSASVRERPLPAEHPDCCLANPQAWHAIATSLALANFRSSVTWMRPARWERRSCAGTFRGNLLIDIHRPEWEWNMSDPRCTDPYDNDLSRRFGVQRSNRAGTSWPWITGALTALGTLALLIGYNWGADHERRAQSSPPATTGSAPSQQRSAPPAKFGNMPAPPSAPNQSPR